MNQFSVDINIAYKWMEDPKGTRVTGACFRLVFDVEPKTKGDIVAQPNYRAIRYKMLTWLMNKWDSRLLVWTEDPTYPHYFGLEPNIVPIPCDPSPDNLAQYLLTICSEQLEGMGVIINNITFYKYPHLPCHASSI